MGAFFIATASIKDPVKFQEYAKKAAKTFESFGGDLIVRGQSSEEPFGSGDHQAVGIVKFPDIKALNDWYSSDDYQSIIRLRDEASEMSLRAYIEPDT